MVRSPIPPWLMIVLSIGGLVVALGVYGILSARQTAINETQSVLPGIKGMGEGFTKIRTPQGTESNPKPSWLWQDTKASVTRLFAGTSIGVVASIVIGILMGSYRDRGPVGPNHFFHGQNSADRNAPAIHDCIRHQYQFVYCHGGSRDFLLDGPIRLPSHATRCHARSNPKGLHAWCVGYGNHFRDYLASNHASHS